MKGVQDKALVAARRATEAAGELIRFTVDGPQDRRPPYGDVEVVELLAAALLGALQVENAEIGDDLGHPDDAEQRDRLTREVTRFLDGWVP